MTVTTVDPRPVVGESTDRMVVVQDIAGFIGERCGKDVAGDGEDLIETGVIDSLMFAELLVYLESKWGIQVSLETVEIEQFRSVVSIAALVRKNRALIEG